MATCANCGCQADDGRSGAGEFGSEVYCRRCWHTWQKQALLHPSNRPRTYGPAGGSATVAGQKDAVSDDTRLVADLMRNLPDKASRTHEKTTLEFKGQWHPKPNGAETGHGVVPEGWELANVSENDRILSTYDWAGGAALCLSNAFGEANRLEAQADDLVTQGLSEDQPQVQSIRALARATEEREAVMRKQWIDIDFQEGEEKNKALLRHLERDFATQMVAVASKQAAKDREEGREATPERTSWFNIKVLGGTGVGKSYLSATFARQDGDVSLHGYDDESGRQRWRLDEDAHGGWFHLRVAAGTEEYRRLLGIAAGTTDRVELCGADDGSGRQRWRLTGSSRSSSDTCKRRWYSIQPLGSGKYLGGDRTGALSLCDNDDASGRQRWLIPEWAGPESEQASLPKAALAKEANEVTSIAVRSGAEGALSLTSLRPEQMTRVLSQNRNLGAAIDLVGCYLKNYEIDKADRLCQRIEPLVRERGGLWLFKFLNEYTVVKMKQGRFQEALAMYDEYEGLIGYDAEEQWELFDTVYRNFGWIYCSMGDYEKSMYYFRRCVEIKKKNGVPPHWFDQWDLGKTHARLCLSKGNIHELSYSLDMIKKGIDLHQQVEQQDKVMLCKMLNSGGECATVLGDYAEFEEARRWYEEAVSLHRRSYEIYLTVLGRHKPLTGWCMEHLAGALRKFDTPKSREEAKDLLHGALAVECSKDIIKLSSMERLLGSVLDVHYDTKDSAGLDRCQGPINIGLDNLHRRKVDSLEAASYATLLRRIAQVLLAHSPDSNRECAVSLLEEAIEYAGKAVDAPAGGQAAETARVLQRLLNSRGGGAAEALWGDDGGSDILTPKAGEQEIPDIDAPRLLAELRAQVERLRSVPNLATGGDVGSSPNSQGQGLSARPPEASAPPEVGGDLTARAWEAVD